jgi:hypothetical protein
MAVVALLPVILALSAMPLSAPTAAGAIPAPPAPPSEPQITLPAPGKGEQPAREAKQAKLGPALRAAAKDANSAGVYIDDTDTPVFLTAGDPAAERGKLIRLIPGDMASRFQRVTHSMKQLRALQDRVNVDLLAGSLQDQGISSTAIDTRANAVVVGSSVVSEALKATLAGKYGDGIVLTFEPPSQGGDACSSRTNCPPAKAGLKINTSNGKYCTSGPMVRVSGSSALRILTAGHCVELTGGTGTSRKWTHHGAGLGWSEFETWADGADADVGLLNPSSYPVSGSRNLLYRASSSDVVGIRSWKPTDEQVQGSLVCRAGAVSGYVCGEIALTNKTKDVDGKSIDHQWVVDFDACPGDSGAPYLSGDVAWGIHTDSTSGCNPNTNQAWYSPMGWVFDTLAQQGHPVELCTDPTCAGPNSWTLRGSLAGTAWSPKLVTLNDGRVLRVGGAVDSAGLAPHVSGAPVTEIFDPGSGAWSNTAAPPWLPNPCAGQFATRLSNGRVLVGGGESMNSSGSDPCAGNAYIFDPFDGSGGSWTEVASMPQTIVAAGAVLLDDGRVFVSGGTGSHGTTSVTLAYSQSRNEWTTLRPAPGGAIAPLVLRLNDGRVLVSGGYTITDNGGPRYAHSTATRLYDPDDDSWSTTTSVGARGVAGLVLSDGRVVVAGGQTLSWDGGQKYSFKTNVNLFNPSNGGWTQLASLRTGRANFTLTQLDSGQLLAAAGDVPSSSSSSGAKSRTVDAYDWSTNTWFAAASLHDARAAHGSAALGDGRILVAGGGTASSETYRAGDLTPPTTATPVARLRSSTTMGTTSVPATITWSAQDAGGSGVGTYDIARSTDGGAYATLASNLTSVSYSTSVTSGRRYAFRVRARDWAGNVGPWKVAASVKPAITQQTSSAIKYFGSWTTGDTSKYSGGTVRYATSSSAKATYTFTGRSIAWVTTRAARSGSAQIWVDGVYAGWYSLHASSYTYRYVAFQRSWSSSGQHTITVAVVGTSGHPRIDIDAFLVLRNP